jgi:VCBS repeat protein
MPTITVTNLYDSGPGSLRQAMLDANSGDTINFAPGLGGGTLTLTSGELDITKNLTIAGDIDGNGTPDITIDAGGASRVFNESGGPAIVAMLDGLVIRDGLAGPGNSGGGIAVGSTDELFLKNSRVTDNEAVAGGGIYGAAASEIVLINTSVFGNSSDHAGGGIYAGNAATLTMANATISGNYSQTTGGGIALGYDASGMLTNTTLAGNSSTDEGGAIYGHTSQIRLYDSTLTGNYAGTAGGGIYNLTGAVGVPLVLLSNSIVAGNAAQVSGADLDLDGSPLFIHGNNIVGSAPANATINNFGTYTQIDGTSQAALQTVFARVGANPHTGVLSGVLADNGGSVRTVAINPAGIAYNTGDNGALPPDSFDLNNNGNTAEPLPVDARGFSRTAGGTVDIGAFEQQAGANFVVTTLADETYDGGTLAQETADGSGLSLREALGLANQDPTSLDTITFAPGLIGGGTHGVNDGALLLTNGELTIDGNVAIEGDIDGNSTPDITIDAGGASRDLVIKGGAVTLDGFTITGGYAYVHGGGVSLGTGAYAPANVTISHSVITNNQAAYGGGISINPGDLLVLTNSVVSGNSAFYGGGGIASEGALALFGSTVSGNSSGELGGGIANYGALFAVNTTIANNQVTDGIDGAGGGLYNYGAATLSNTTIAGNKAGYAGGGVYNSGFLLLTNATIANNSAYNGGGLYNAPCGCGDATLTSSTVTGNYANQFSGGIYNANGSVTLTNSLVAGNRAGYQGSDVANGTYATTNYTGVNLFSQTGVGRPGTDIVQPDLTQVFATLTTIDPDGSPANGDEFQAGTLANNGGPAQTVAIKVGGNAQDTGSTADLPPDFFDLNNNNDTSENLPVDARGLPRVSGPAVDIGAFEAQPPVLTNLPASASYTEQAAPVELSPAFGNPGALTITDVGVPPDQSVIASAVVTVATGAVAGDVLAADTTGTGITASYDSATETLTLTGSDTLADYAQVLDSVTFSSPSDNPDDFGSKPTRTVTWSVTDVSGATSAPGTTTVSITAVNDPPTLSNLPSVALFFEESSIILAPQATFQFPGVSVTDPDSLTLANATVAITGGTFPGDHDLLSVPSFSSITASYNSSAETLTLTGPDTLAHYQVVINSIVFSAGENPTNYGSNPTRTVVWTLNDGSASNNLSTSTETISVNNVNDPPTLAAAASANYTEEGAAATLSGSASVSDPDDLNLSSATVKITGGMFSGDGDVLAVTTTGTGITASYNSTTEVLTLTGSDTLAHYQSVLDSLTYSSTSDNPTDYGSVLSRVLTWTVNDGGGSNNTNAAVFTTVVITAINDPPTLSNVAAVVGFVPQHTITISPATTVSDPDSATLTNATVKVTGGTFAGDGDVLAANVAGTSVTSSYNAATETLTLTGSDTLAHYQQVLDSVTFSSGSNPSNGNNNRTRTVTWVVNDGSGSFNLSAAATTTITIGASVRNDFDADNKSDLLLQNNPFFGTPDVRVELLNGFTVAASGTTTTPVGWHVVASGDFNHDNKADILLQNNDGLPQIWLVNGTSVTSTVALTNPGPSWHVIATGDFDSDGNADILWQNDDGRPAIWLMNGTSLASFAGFVNPGTSWHVIGAGDFNGDGHADILWQNSDGRPAIWEMNGLSLVSFAGLLNPGSAWHEIGTGDFNGDGHADILWQNDDGRPAIWEMNGFSLTSFAGLTNPGTSWHVIGTSDFNGDGMADIAWQNNDGTPAIWQMNGLSLVTFGALPNPGATWHVKDDGPIGPDQPAGVPVLSAPDVAPALHLSAPDVASAAQPSLTAWPGADTSRLRQALAPGLAG